jgi:hypothetical protein
MKPELSGTYFGKKDATPNFMNIHPVGAQMFHTGIQTADHEDDNSRFSQFCERAFKRTQSDLMLC